MITKVLTQVPEDAGGALLVDKPAGMSSAAVVAQIKKQFRLQRIGHAGTLDPFATGLLIVLFGKATRLQDIVMSGGKTYQGNFWLGRTTNSDDTTGEDLSNQKISCDRWLSICSKLKSVERMFTGTIEQTPPAISAVKINGERSYKRARRGEVVAPTARAVTIQKLSLTPLENPLIHYSVSCSKGTYIRSLARDIGEYFGVGGCVDTLRRSESFPFSVEDAIDLETLLTADSLQSVSCPFIKLVSAFPKYQLPNNALQLLRNGDQRVLSILPCDKSGYALLTDVSELPAAFLERAEDTAWRVKFMI